MPANVLFTQLFFKHSYTHLNIDVIRNNILFQNLHSKDKQLNNKNIMDEK